MKKAYKIQATLHAYITVDGYDEEDAIVQADQIDFSQWSDLMVLSYTIVDVNPTDDYEDASRDFYVDDHDHELAS